MPSGGWKDSDRLERLPPGWNTVVRPAVFALYGDKCHWCGLGGSDGVDHLEPGDDHSLRNLRPIHDDPCHRQKSAREGVEARAKRRAESRMPTETHPGLL
jgi:5-methylcytosine-specific restriction protein A